MSRAKQPGLVFGAKSLCRGEVVRECSRLITTVDKIRPMGWYLDILVGYAIRTLIRFVRTLQSEKWPVEEGTVSSAICPAAVYGGPVAEIAYTYRYNGEYYSGIQTRGFLLRDSAQTYVNGIIVGGQMAVCVNPIRPEQSILAESGL